MSLKIASWNVNSVRARLPHLLAWLKESSPDIALLQELKCEEHNVPRMEIEDAGYTIVSHSEKTYNGVAILSKSRIEDVTMGLFGDDTLQTRYIEGVTSIDGKLVRVASVYVPNGQSPDSDKFTYKLRFLELLRDRLKDLLSFEEVCVIGGDFNVAPFPIDVYDPKSLDGSVCYHPEERKRLRAILFDGWADSFRQNHPSETAFSWWDYRAGAFERNLGFRIDHLLLSPLAADRMTESGIDSSVRAQEKASDHAPAWCKLEL